MFFVLAAPCFFEQALDDRNLAWLGVTAPLFAYVCIAVSIAMSPWFGWNKNALSDLGHSTTSSVAAIYNFGLSASGLLTVLFGVTAARKHAKWTSLCLIFTGFSLQLVGMFDEVYGILHVQVSVLFFVSLAVCCLVYAIEKKSYMGLTGFIIGVAGWILYWLRVYRSGVAVPEMIAALIVLPMLASMSLKIYREK